MTSLPTAHETSETTHHFEQHWSRTALLVRALLPSASEAEGALREVAVRIATSQPRRSDDDFAAMLEGIIRDVVVELRRHSSQGAFSDDLIRQLVDSAPTSPNLVAERPRVLANIIGQLPFTERELLRRKYSLALTPEQIAVAESRPTSVVSRDLTILHGTIVNALAESLRDGGPPAPGGATDLGRLSDQPLDGTISEDGRIVLETLLLADNAAQAHYHRHVALAVELEWHFRGVPRLPEPPRIGPRRLTRREVTVTAAFLLTCVLAAAFIVLLFTGQLRNWF